MHHTPLQPQQLEAFVAVMSAGSVTAAARILGRSQPAVTRSIQELEGELGLALFRRNGPRITPTDAATRFLADAEHALLGLRDLRARAADIRSARPPVLDIVAVPALASGLVPAALAAMPEALRPSRIHVQGVSAELVVQRLLSRGADLGLASAPVDHPGLDVAGWGQAPCVAALRADDPLAGAQIVSVADLNGRSLVSMANPFRLRGRIDDALAAADVEPERVIDTNSSSVALSLVRATGGVGLLEPATAYGAPMEGVVIRPLNADIPFVFAVLRPAGRPASPAAEALVDLLFDTAADRLPGFRRSDDMPAGQPGREGDER